MIARALLLLGLASATAMADWQTELTAAQPGSFPPFRPLQARYTFGWSAFTAAEVTTDYSTTKDGLLRLQVKGKTIGAPRGLWRMDSDSVSLVRAKTLQPVSVVQNETYKDETRKTTVIFGPEGAVRTRATIPADKDSGKTKKFKFAPVHDLHSALLFIRSQPLKNGDKVRLVAYPAAQAFLAEVEVLGREKVKVRGQSMPAIKLGLRLQKIGKDLKLERHKKFKRAHGWLSDDADRLLVKVEAEVMIGKVWMELEDVEFAQAGIGGTAAAR